MRFVFRLTGVGWAEATLEHEGHWVKLTASYLSDALGDLLSAVAKLQDGEESAVASWTEEPGEYRWLFKLERDQLNLRVLAFEDSYPPLPEDEGFPVFIATCPLDELAAAVVQGARSVLDDVGGAEGYRAKWLEDPFPSALLERVESNLGAR